MHRWLLSLFIVLIGSFTVFAIIFLTQSSLSQVQAVQIAARPIATTAPKAGAENLATPPSNSNVSANKPTQQSTNVVTSVFNSAVEWVRNIFTPSSSAPGEKKFNNNTSSESKNNTDPTYAPPEGARRIGEPSNNTNPTPVPEGARRIGEPSNPGPAPAPTPEAGGARRIGEPGNTTPTPLPEGARRIGEPSNPGPSSTPTDGTKPPTSTPTDGTKPPTSTPTDGTKQPTSTPTDGTKQPTSTPTDGTKQPSSQPTGGTVPPTQPQPSSGTPNDGDDDDDDSDSPSGGNPTGGSNRSGDTNRPTTGTPVSAVPTPVVPGSNFSASTLVCSTGFNRPLLFGVSPSSGASYELGEGDTLKNAGSTMATVPLNWDVIQPSGPQDYNPEMTNFPIRKGVQSGLTVVVNVSGTPNWATGNEGLPPHKAQPNKANDVVNREFREMVRQAVRDNKDKVKYWSYWNEPNGCMSSAGNCGYTGDSLEDFAYWHQVFYDTVKAEDPSAKIIFGNLDFTGPNISFIRAAHDLDDIDIKYDYLGINAYNKKKNAPLPIEWVKAAYDAQPSDYKKPIWLNEWGFDRIWWGCEDGACRDQARLDIAKLVEDGFNKIVAADYIYAAQYHNLRDVGGDYGLWDDDQPRPAGIKFREYVASKCAPVPAGTTPQPTGPACVTSSNDLGANKLQRGQQVTFSSVANVPINRFKYNFYIPGSSGTPAKAFCVQGLTPQPNDGCPAGSGQLVIESRGDNEGAMQASDWIKMPNNQVLQSFWKGNIGSNRRVPFDANFGGTAAISWNFSNYVSNLNIGGPYRPMAEIDAMATYSTNNQTATMEIWRNNQMWYNVVPFNGDGSNFDWGRAEGWKMYKDFNSAADKNFWPGTGLVTARASFVGKDNKLWHVYWRGNEEWARGVPIVNGLPNSALLENAPNKGFIRTRTLSELNTATNTTGKVQALSYIVMPDGNVQEQIWINNQVRKRTIPLAASGTDFTKAGAYQIISSGGLTAPTDQADSISVDYAKLYQQDTNLKKIPDMLQINTTFETVDGKSIGNHSSCVTWMGLEKSIPGDLDANCLVDIYDYNILMEQQGKTNCQYNIAGDCKIDATDIAQFLPLYGTKCPAN